MSKKPKNLLTKQSLILVIVVSFLVSAIIGFIAGSAAFELAHYVSQNKFLQRLIPEEVVPKEEKQMQQRNEENLASDGLVDREERIVSIVEEVSPAVVSIIITKDLPVLERYMADPFEDFFEDNPFSDDFGFNFEIPQYRQKGTEKQEIGGGTGFVVGKNGLILTNRHVVSDKEADYTVLTNDGERHKAKVIARDLLQDLAFLRVAGLEIDPLKLGDSDNIKIGQTAITIGNALGEFSNTVNVGVISGLKRTITASSGFGGSSEELDQVIQTDAAINRGNSGGPLLNIKGEVIGLNTAMAVGAENIGFAIPINVAKKDIETIIKEGEIVYPYLGVRYVLINKLIQEQNNLSVDYGALIIRGDSPTELAITPGSPADKVGLKENDIILEVNGQKIDEENSLAKVILNCIVGEEITLKVFSKGDIKTVKAKLAKMPSNFD